MAVKSNKVELAAQCIDPFDGTSDELDKFFAQISKADSTIEKGGEEALLEVLLSKLIGEAKEKTQNTPFSSIKGLKFELAGLFG